MNRGGKIVGTAAMLSVAACSGEQGKLQIRPTPTPLAAGHQSVPLRIAEARGQFAMGNVALALEAFRKALREDPGSVDAMTGVAACYDKMARFDLSRRHYEAALAIAPRDPQLLAAFAASLDLQGRKAEAASVRAEIHQRIAMAARESLPQPAPAPALRPNAVEVAATQPPALAVPASAVPPVPRKVAAERSPSPLPVQEVAAKPIRAAKAAPAASPATRATVTAATARSVTVTLPPARPVAPPLPERPPVRTVAATALSPTLPTTPPPAKVAVQSVALPAPARTPAVPAPAAPAVEADVSIARPQAAPVAAVAVAVAASPVTQSPKEVSRAEPEVVPVPVDNTGPRLERTSLSEVALITTPAPQWRALTVKRTQRSATVRFVPLRQASINLSNIRLLNAARVNRLAARTRSYLIGRGWSPMAIGDAPAVRARSVIFYPPERRRTAQTLSAQFGFVMQARPGSRQITVLLGRDAARISPLRASG